MNEPRLISRHFKGVIDSTLREGWQFSRAEFTLSQQKKIYSYLGKIGVDYVEVGNPAKSEVRAMIADLVRLRRSAGPGILGHVRNKREDISRAVDCGLDGVNILCTADAERIAAMGLTEDEYERRLEDNVALARAAGLEVRVGVEDVFNQDPRISLAIYKLAEGLRVDRIAAADTLGKAMSWEVFRRIRDIRRCLTTDLEVHFHNDLGHAVSNSLAALQAGANWVSATLMGIGERTGITPLSSLLVNLFVLDSRIADRYNLRWLTQAELYISRVCDIEMPPHLMTNTVNGFAHKAGIHLDALIKFGPHKYEALSPQIIGNRRNLVIDTVLSGKTRARDVVEFQKRFG
jgi:homocitrate synthase